MGEPSMVERVATVLRDSFVEPMDDGVSMFVARKLIAAMREPSAAMVRASAPAFRQVNAIIGLQHARNPESFKGLSYDPVPEAWRAMIDAALAEGGEG